MESQKNNQPIFSRQKLEEAVEYLKRPKSTIRGLSQHLGCSRQTLYNWADDYADFKKAYRAWRRRKHG